VPAAVGKMRSSSIPAPPDAHGMRLGWTLDLLAWARHGAVAHKVDMRGERAPMPPILLANGEQIVALELAGAVRALSSRPRAFSQVAARFSPMVIGSQDSGARLVIEIWDVDAEPDDDDAKLAGALAKYLTADVRFFGRTAAAAALAGVSEWPQALLERNPLAWVLTLQRGLPR